MARTWISARSRLRNCAGAARDSVPFAKRIGCRGCVFARRGITDARRRLRSRRVASHGFWCSADESGKEESRSRGACPRRLLRETGGSCVRRNKAAGLLRGGGHGLAPFANVARG